VRGLRADLSRAAEPAAQVSVGIADLEAAIEVGDSLPLDAALASC
jgi:hypothetical protein